MSILTFQQIRSSFLHIEESRTCRVFVPLDRIVPWRYNSNVIIDIIIIV